MPRYVGSRSDSLWLAAALGAAALGCRYDADERCGPHQQLEGERCVCAPGYGLSGTQCVACGENEVGSLSGCSCALGFSRASANGPCVEQDTLGQSCTSDGDCQHPVYSYCHLTDEGGYCTRANCADSDDCESSIDYACNDRAEPSFCERPPTGVGTACGSSADCAGFEASYCESVSAKVCLPNGCKQDPERCHGDWVCCDIALLASRCVFLLTSSRTARARRQAC